MKGARSRCDRWHCQEHFIQHPHSVFQMFGFHFHQRLYAGPRNTKNPSFCPHFLISLIHDRITIFFIENKGVLSQACITNVNQKMTRFHFAAFNPDYSQRLPEAMWGATGCEDVGWIGSACQVLLCILQSDRDESKGWKWMGHRTCSSSEIKTVCLAVAACSVLPRHWLPVLICRGMTCDAGKTWAKREKGLS